MVSVSFVSRAMSAIFVVLALFCIKSSEAAAVHDLSSAMSSLSARQQIVVVQVGGTWYQCNNTGYVQCQKDNCEGKRGADLTWCRLGCFAANCKTVPAPTQTPAP